MRSDFKTACCRLFSEHWTKLRSGAEPPHVSEFLDRPEPALQPHIALLDVIADETLRVRLFATRLTALAGFDLTGANVYQFFHSPRLVLQVQSVVRAVTTLPCGIYSMKRATTSSGANVAIEMLSLPLRPFANGAPVIAAAIDVAERLEPRDSIFGFMQYLSAEWVDLGHGVPATDPAPR